MKKEVAAWVSSERQSIEQGRMEIKYVVPEKTAEEVLQWASMFLKSDCISQRVTSLYLDTPTLRFFRWHLDAYQDRFKLRVRGYGDQLGDRFYAEVKRKTGCVVRKQRAEIPGAALSAVLGGTGAISEQAFDESGSEALRSFLDKRAAFCAEPKMLVSCQRQSLRENSVTGEVAVTVDHAIQYQETSRRDLVSDPFAWRPISLPSLGSSEASIIELKYSSRPPQWMGTLIARLVPHRVNFSKYKAAMQQEAVWSNGHVQSQRCV